MKKIIALLLTILMVCSLAACAGNDNGSKNNHQGNNTTENRKETDTNTDTKDSLNSAQQPESTGETLEDAQPETPESGKKALVAYFSATNTTEGVAETIADSLGADLYEITPEDPYTDADLDYHDDKSRSTIEMNDSNARPEISGSVENMDQYDVVFIGYPIWWGEAPRILNTFVESYDFSGKTVVPFCTSGGSGVGSSAKNLEKLTSGATWLSGTRLNGGASHSSIVEWINGLELEVTAK